MEAYWFALQYFLCSFFLMHWPCSANKLNTSVVAMSLEERTRPPPHSLYLRRTWHCDSFFPTASHVAICGLASPHQLRVNAYNSKAKDDDQPLLDI